MSSGSVVIWCMKPNAAKRQALDHDLHAQVGHVPPLVGDDVVEQQPQVGVDRVVARQLVVEVLGEDLDVPGLVHDLGGGVVLGVDPRDRLDDLGRAHERALLAVHELRQRPVLALHAELDPFLVTPARQRGPAHVEAFTEAPVGHGVGHHELLLVDLGLPGEVGLAVPLRLLGLLVELLELGALPLCRSPT